MILLTTQCRLCCLRCIQAGYVSCVTRSQNPNYGTVDSSDLQNLLDLDYPVDKEAISASELWSRWRDYQLPNWSDRPAGNTRKSFQCSFFHLTRSVDIKEHTLDGKAFY
jgi:hypothetical protein